MLSKSVLIKGSEMIGDLEEPWTWSFKFAYCIIGLGQYTGAQCSHSGYSKCQPCLYRTLNWVWMSHLPNLTPCHPRPSGPSRHHYRWCWRTGDDASSLLRSWHFDWFFSDGSAALRQARLSKRQNPCQADPITSRSLPPPQSSSGAGACVF